MKKQLLMATAIAGLAFVASPALADGLSLDVGGQYRGYVMYSDSDEATGAANSLREFDFRNDTEIHFKGETTLDNGLTVGVATEMDLGTDATTRNTDETYAYFSGGWGRVNFGLEDGAAYLLQVAAPSADTHVDGMRVRFNSVQNLIVGSLAALNQEDYANDALRRDMKITYMTPKFNGFQAGVSYVPEVTDANGTVGGNLGNMNGDETAADLDNGWEIAGRWDGEFEGVGVSAGLGFVGASEETTNVGGDDYEAWDAGLNFTFGAFSFGGAYLETNQSTANNADVDVWTLGADWTNGPYTVGATWYNSDEETGAATDAEMERFTFGGTYSYGPGMSFRGAVAFGDYEETGLTDTDFTQITLGTEIKF